MASDITTEPGFIASGPIHANAFRYGETDACVSAFKGIVAQRFGKSNIRVEMRAHPNSLLNLEGDRLMVAFDGI